MTSWKRTMILRTLTTRLIRLIKSWRSLSIGLGKKLKLSRGRRKSRRTLRLSPRWTRRVLPDLTKFARGLPRLREGREWSQKTQLKLPIWLLKKRSSSSMTKWKAPSWKTSSLTRRKSLLFWDSNFWIKLTQPCGNSICKKIILKKMVVKGSQIGWNLCLTTLILTKK